MMAKISGTAMSLTPPPLRKWDSNESDPTTTTKKTDLDKPNIKKAIAQGKEMIKSGMSKADVSREIYDLVKDEEKEVILQVFQQGASLTEKQHSRGQST
jgi:hypothetical protein